MLRQSALSASFGRDLISELFPNENIPNAAHQFDWRGIHFDEKSNYFQFLPIRFGLVECLAGY